MPHYHLNQPCSPPEMMKTFLNSPTILLATVLLASYFPSTSSLLETMPHEVTFLFLPTSFNFTPSLPWNYAPRGQLHLHSTPSYYYLVPVPRPCQLKTSVCESLQWFSNQVFPNLQFSFPTYLSISQPFPNILFFLSFFTRWVFPSLFLPYPWATHSLLLPTVSSTL